MKGAAGATVKIGAIQKDARTLNESGGRVAILVGLGNAVFALVLELPLVGRKAFCGLLDSLDVLLVDEVGSVTAAPLPPVLRRDSLGPPGIRFRRYRSSCSRGM